MTENAKVFNGRRGRVAVPRGVGDPSRFNRLGCLTRLKRPEKPSRGPEKVSNLSGPPDGRTRVTLEAMGGQSFTVTLTPIAPSGDDASRSQPCGTASPDGEGCGPALRTDLSGEA